MAKLSVKPPKTWNARLRGFRQSPQKARLVADMVRGMKVGQALNVLKFTHNRAARPIEETVRSAVANAVQESNRTNLGLNEDDLVIAEIKIDQALSFSRWRPRSRGMANPYTRYFCQISVSVAQERDLESLKLYRQITSQKKRVDRIKDLKGLQVVGADASSAMAKAATA
jgi:large subunit ribosomal protein L22